MCSIFVLMTMSEVPKSRPGAPSDKPARRGGSSGIERATRREKIQREERIVSLPNRGASVQEIAASEGLTLKRRRNVVREILSERMPAAPAEFLALQISRLNEALLVSYSAMHTTAEGTNFEAVDRVVKIVRELDRYHGFSAAVRQREEPEARQLLSSIERPLALESPDRSDSLIMPQAIENAQSGLANSPLPGERGRRYLGVARFTIALASTPVSAP